jgi:glycosyltransferase involved in cell wall biosynthesis
MVKVSVVIPIYNVEKYLDEGIESIRRQTLEDLEIILVNDGSTDGSLNICREHAARDGRIKVIDKPNSGVSAARNAGIEAANGEYIGFVDPDDWAEPEMFEKMYGRAREINADVCMCNYVRNLDGKAEPIRLNINHDLLTREDIVNEVIAGMISSPDLNSGAAAIMGSVWRCLFSRDLIDRQRIRFIEGIPFMEDTIFCVQVFSQCSRVAIDEGFYYNYRIIMNSATASYKKYLPDNQKKVYGLLEGILRDEKLDGVLQERLDLRFVNMDFDLIANEVHRDNPKTYSKKIDAIFAICRDKNLKRILNSLDTSGYTLRKRFILKAMKNESAALIYMYYIVIARLL